MTITGTKPAESQQQAREAARRAAYIQALRDLADFYERNGAAPLPGIDGHHYVSIPVPPGRHEERLETLAETARRLATEVTKQGGTLWAKREFGPVVLEAHVNDADYIPALLGAADARKAAMAAGSGAAA